MDASNIEGSPDVFIQHVGVCPHFPDIYYGASGETPSFDVMIVTLEETPYTDVPLTDAFWCVEKPLISYSVNT